MKTEYWTMFKYGDCDTICSKHKTVLAAKRSMLRCEKVGGAKHRIVKVQFMKRPKA